MNLTELLGAVAGGLLLLVAAFQLALVFGAPWGAATMGGRATTVDGVLVGRLRAVAGVNAAILIGAAAVLALRAGTTGRAASNQPAIVWATWGIVAFMALNTIANLAARHPFERWFMGATTLAVTVLGVAIALQ